MLQNTLREKMKSGQAVNGIFINSGSSIACEIAGLARFDFALIDSEHGPTDVLTNRNLITAAEYRGIAPIIRVSNKSEDLILRTLDVGAHGIMVPQVNTAEQAAAIVGAAKYYPEGHRGVATTRAADYGFCMPLSHYFQMANQRNLVIVQCESLACIPHLDEICAVDGVDVVFVGPYDLSSSMGTPGKVDYESIHETVDRVLEATAAHEKFAGIFTKDPEEAKFYEEIGFRFIITGTDISCMTSGIKAIAEKLKR